MRKFPILILFLTLFMVSELRVHAGGTVRPEARQFTFQLAPGVTREQVRFKNRFGIELCADIYKPAAGGSGGKLPAIVAGGPLWCRERAGFGALRQ